MFECVGFEKEVLDEELCGTVCLGGARVGKHRVQKCISVFVLIYIRCFCCIVDALCFVWCGVDKSIMEQDRVVFIGKWWCSPKCQLESCQNAL